MDHVIVATGYRVDVNSLDQPEPRVKVARAGAFPRLRPSLESSVPDLFFSGVTAAATFGSLMRFVCGTGVAADGSAPRLRTGPGRMSSR